MALKVELKPGEKLLVGNCIITNSDQRTRLFIEGRAPILREKDILTSETATTPAKRIYLAVQLMYTSKDPRTHHEVSMQPERLTPSCRKTSSRPFPRLRTSLTKSITRY